MFREVADGVLVARYREWDVNVGLVLGGRGALVVDTRAGAAQGRQVAEQVLAVAPGTRVTHVVNTHAHFDHTFGNIAFAGATIHAHTNVWAAARRDARRVKAALRADPGPALRCGCTGADVADLLATAIRPADSTFDRSTVIDLGDRQVVLRYAGRGHTDGDIGVFVPDAGVAFLGDLVEESAPPSFGDDCWPLEWADTLRALAGPLLGGPPAARPLAAGSVVVPGHGRPVDAGFVRRQFEELAAVATVIRERRLAGLSLEEAQHTPDARLAYPLPSLANAFARVWGKRPAG